MEELDEFYGNESSEPTEPEDETLEDNQEPKREPKAENNLYSTYDSVDRNLKGKYGQTTQHILQHPEANKEYTYSSIEALLNNPAALLKMVQGHMKHAQPRFNLLLKYYEGHNYSINEALKRRTDSSKSDVRIAHNYCKLITQTQVGYIHKEPVSITSTDEAVNELIVDANQDLNIEYFEQELLTNISIYGRAYELQYRNLKGSDKIGISDVRNTFLILDETIEANIIGGVRYLEGTNQQGDNTLTIELYDDKHIYNFLEYNLNDHRAELLLTPYTDEEPNPRRHLYENVPIIEYRNNYLRRADFEDVIGLVDALDAIESDLVNYSNDSVDGMFQITGRLSQDSLSPQVRQAFSDANISYLEPQIVDGKESQIKGEYIHKSYDVQGLESLKQSIINSIHKLSNTPDITNSTHSNISKSGVAMRYELWGIDQSASYKQVSYTKGAKLRYKFIYNLRRALYEAPANLNIKNITVRYTKNVPEDKAEMLKVFIEAGGKISNETLLELLTFVNSKQEKERLDNEKQQ